LAFLLLFLCLPSENKTGLSHLHVGRFVWWGNNDSESIFFFLVSLICLKSLFLLGGEGYGTNVFKRQKQTFDFLDSKKKKGKKNVSTL